MATLDFCYCPVGDESGHRVQVPIWELRWRLFSSKRLRFTVFPTWHEGSAIFRPSHLSFALLVPFLVFKCYNIQYKVFSSFSDDGEPLHQWTLWTSTPQRPVEVVRGSVDAQPKISGIKIQNIQKKIKRIEKKTQTAHFLWYNWMHQKYRAVHSEGIKWCDTYSKQQQTGLKGNSNI